MKVFVYGTLKSGYSNHYLLTDATFIKETTVRGDLINFGAYPALVAGDNDILGEVYEISHRTLRDLDLLESNGTLYKRRKVNGVWVYFYIYKGYRPTKYTQHIKPNKDGVVVW